MEKENIKVHVKDYASDLVKENEKTINDLRYGLIGLMVVCVSIIALLAMYAS